MKTSVNLKIVDQVGIIEIANERKKNALNEELLEELLIKLGQIDSNSNIRVAILTGRGEDFCAGVDIGWIKDADLKKIRAINLSNQARFRKIEQFSKPLIASIDGIALGAGLGLALYCDLRIASREARLGLPEVKLGMPVIMGFTKKLVQTVGTGRAKEILFTGDLLTAEQAYNMGIVNYITPKGALKEESLGFAKKLSQASPLAVSVMKEVVNKSWEMSTEALFAYELNFFENCWASEDRKEGFQAFLEKRAPFFKGT